MLVLLEMYLKMWCHYYSIMILDHASNVKLSKGRNLSYIHICMQTYVCITVWDHVLPYARGEEQTRSETNEKSQASGDPAAVHGVHQSAPLLCKHHCRRLHSAQDLTDDWGKSKTDFWRMYACMYCNSSPFHLNVYARSCRLVRPRICLSLTVTLTHM